MDNHQRCESRISSRDVNLLGHRLACIFTWDAFRNQREANHRSEASERGWSIFLLHNGPISASPAHFLIASARNNKEKDQNFRQAIVLIAHTHDVGWLRHTTVLSAEYFLSCLHLSSRGNWTHAVAAHREPTPNCQTLSSKNIKRDLSFIGLCYFPRDFA